MDEPRPWIPEVKISADGMRAMIILPEPKECEPSVDVAVEALVALGVTAPIDRAAIEEAIRSQRWQQGIVAATGIPPVHGVDSSVQYLIDAHRELRLEESKDGRVDYKHQNLIQSVEANHKLAVRVPASPGQDGTKVTGEEVKARPGRTLPLPAGKNVTASEDGNSLFAALDGQATIDRDGFVHVHPVYVVEGDVDMATGHVQFIGSVLVKGNVAPGFNVEAQGNIDVRGFASMDLLSAGNHVTIAKGIQGRGKGLVRARGNVTALFIENATVESGGAVSVRDAVMHSNVSAKSRVEVIRGKGVIVGGLVRAGEEVMARTIGSTLATPTEIEVGVDPELREKITKAVREIEEKNAEMERVDQALRLLQAKMGPQGVASLDPERKAMMLKLLRHRVLLVDEINALSAERVQLETQLRSNKNGRVVCDVLYPGVKITVGQASIQTTDEWYSVVLYLAEDGKVGISSKR